MDITLNMNERALKIVMEMVEKADELNVKVHRAPCKATIIDAGVEVKGSLMAGLYVTRICLADLANISITNMNYGQLTLPAIHVSTDYPSITTMGSQLADWEICIEGYYGLGSGPARALALERPLPKAVALKKDFYEKIGYQILNPKQIYEKIGYGETADVAVIVIEAPKLPPDAVLIDIAEKCKVKAENVYAIITPTTSIAGSVQIAGRIVEVGIHKLTLLGFDPKNIIFGSGCSPIAPVHPNMIKAMGIVNDVIRYAGSTFYIVNCDDEEYLKNIISRVPSSSSNKYYKTFMEIFKEANYSFYNIDLGEFSPATITVNNVKTGNIFSAGEINPTLLKMALTT
jgi:methenyltetrahydromethanopterin cyclohydrolase